MAIVQMVSAQQYLQDPDNIRVVFNYPGHEMGLHHSCDCPHYSAGRVEQNVLKLHDDCPIGWDKCKIVQPLYMQTSNVGMVLSIGEYNGRDDSDFYADVWENEKIVRITYASTRGWTYPNNAYVDATPEVVRAAEQFLAAQQAERRQLAAAAQKEKDDLLASKEKKLAEQAQRINRMKNKNVHVSFKNKQETGKLFWIGPSKTKESLRVGVKRSDGFIIWTSADKVIALAD